MNTRLYKYRDLSNFRYLVDIFLNNRLYAASYTNMNDPMEGMYRYHWDWDKEDTFDLLIKEISKEKQKIGICCLSKKSNNELMWGHYSDGNRGLVIGLEVNDEDAVSKPIQYLNEIISLDIQGSSPREKVQTILSKKLKAWEYEEEQRVFIPNPFVKVNIKEVILGSRMPQETKEDMKNLLNKLNDNIQISEQSI